MGRRSIFTLRPTTATASTNMQNVEGKRSLQTVQAGSDNSGERDKQRPRREAETGRGDREQAETRSRHRWNEARFGTAALNQFCFVIELSRTRVLMLPASQLPSLRHALSVLLGSNSSRGLHGSAQAQAAAFRPSAKQVFRRSTKPSCLERVLGIALVPCLTFHVLE